MPQILAIFHRDLTALKMRRRNNDLSVDRILVYLEELVELSAEIAAEQAYLCQLLEQHMGKNE